MRAEKLHSVVFFKTAWKEFKNSSEYYNIIYIKFVHVRSGNFFELVSVVQKGCVSQWCGDNCGGEIYSNTKKSFLICMWKKTKMTELYCRLRQFGVVPVTIFLFCFGGFVTLLCALKVVSRLGLHNRKFARVSAWMWLKIVQLSLVFVMALSYM